MKSSKKITSIIITFFLIIAIIIIGRTMVGNHFKKKFSKRPPPGLIITNVKNLNFTQRLESFGTAGNASKIKPLSLSIIASKYSAGELAQTINQKI